MFYIASTYWQAIECNSRYCGTRPYIYVRRRSALIIYDYR